MGVRGLKTYLEKHCKEACYEIHLPTRVAQYRTKTGREPEIVVDGHGCMRKWYEGLDWTIGLEIQELIERMRTFVESLTRAGVKLTFYFDGVHADHKYDVWRKRQQEKLEKTEHVFNFLRDGGELANLPKELESFPASMGVIASLILKYVLKCTVYVCEEDGDDEIIRHVEKHQSFAILSHDTDFVITHVQCLMLHSGSLDTSSLTVTCYDRKRFAAKLGIKPEELPLFAILSGNDEIPPDMVRSFHHRLCHQRNDRGVSYTKLMPALGRYIRELPEYSKLRTIFRDVFQSTGLEFEKIQHAYDTYFVHKKPEMTPPVEDEWGKIVAKAAELMIDVSLHHFNYDVVKNLQFESSLNFEDFRRISDQNSDPRQRPYVTITRPLRQRLYGILLKEKPKGDKDIAVSEWCAENKNHVLKRVLVRPTEPPKGYHPGLLELWSPNEGDKSKIEVQLKLFLWAISPKIEDIEPWIALPNDLVTSTALLYYLIHEFPGYMMKWEAHAVMATLALHSSYDRVKLKSLPIEHDVRQKHLTVAVIRTFYLILGLMGTCGFPIPLSEDTAYLKLEGKLFQNVYSRAKSGKSYEELCEKNETALNTFHQMKDIIFRE